MITMIAYYKTLNKKHYNCSVNYANYVYSYIEEQWYIISYLRMHRGGMLSIYRRHEPGECVIIL